MTEQLKPSQLKAWRENRLKRNRNLCELCGLEVLPGQAVADHCHETGHLRGVIHRSCNATLGHVERGKRYGKNFSPTAFAMGLAAYLLKDKTLPLHPSHGKPKRRRRKA